MKDFKDIEKRLRNGKLPDSDMSKHRIKVWQKLLQAQRNRRKLVSFLSISPSVWVLGWGVTFVKIFSYIF